jgi:hypothetical protein
MGRLSNFAHKFPYIFMSAVKKLKRVARSSAKGIFPPIGIASILILTALTVGAPVWSAGVKSLPYYVFLGIGIIFGVLLWKIPRERYSTIFASTFGWLPVVLGMLSSIFWYPYAVGYEVGGEFFHAAADVLPVLLLATVIDVRRTNELEGKQLVLPIAAVFLGELAALNSLAFPEDVRPSDFAAVASSLVTASVALVLAVMADVAPSASDDRRDIEKPPDPTTAAEANTAVTAQTEAGLDAIEETQPPYPQHSPTMQQPGGLVQCEPLVAEDRKQHGACTAP